MPYTIPSGSLTNGTTGLEGLLVYESSQVSILFPSILFFILITISTMGYMANKRKNVTANFMLWLAIGSYITLSLAIIMFLIPGMIGITTLVVFAIISFLSTLGMLFSDI